MRDELTNRQERGTPAPPPGARGGLHRLRVSRPRGSALGLPEVIALAVSMLLLVTAVGAYLFMLRPQRARAQSLTEERAALERQLPNLRSNISQDKDTQTSVREILDSLQGFETEHLGQGAGGSTNVIEELNALIRKNNLRISGGLAFTQLEETVPGTEKKGQPPPPREGGTTAGAARRTVQSVFPGIGITLTVEGTYPNLRHFIRDVEASRQFIVVDSVELEGITDNSGGSSAASLDDLGAQPGAGLAGANPAIAKPGGARGTLVSLRLDMAAYFRRAGIPGDVSAPAAGTATR